MSTYAVVDLEMCMVPKRIKRYICPYRNELIQIGAVLLDDNLEIIDSFVTFVAPRFGEIDKFIHELTGISQKDLEGAPDIQDALELFLAWLPEDAVLVSWSKSDEMQIRKEVEHKEIHIPELQKYLDSWIDCQDTFSELMDAPKVYRLSEALIIADIDLQDGAHDALVDARNTALLFAKMEREGDELQLSPYYVCSDAETTASMCTPFAELLKDFNCA
ncbi:MAG: exonuclease domain-containing protein [Ruminococcus sp.]|nr:exonuclease domain-containing protein [Ruminococcus sp.]